MMRLRVVSVLACVMAIIGVAANSCEAGFITQTASVSSNPTDYSILASPAFKTFSSAIVGVSGGPYTLTGVDIKISGIGTSSGTVTKTQSAGRVSVDFKVDLTAGSNNAAIQTILDASNGGNGLVETIVGSHDFGRLTKDQVVNYNDSLTGLGQTLSLTGADLNPFKSGPSFKLSVDAFAYFSATVRGGNVVISQNSFASAVETVTYYYEPQVGPNIVPEPSTMALGAIGILGLLIRSRRRNLVA